MRAGAQTYSILVIDKKMMKLKIIFPALFVFLLCSCNHEPKIDWSENKDRIFLKNPPVLILDEATSSIDTKTELLVQEGIEALLKGRTSFVIAHRLSTIQKADRIFVIDNGGIIEQGNHNELMAKHGAYYNLQMSQLKDVI